MTNNLFWIASKRKALTHQKRLSFLVRLKHVLTTIEEIAFVNLVIECIHSNHHAILKEYLNNRDKLYILQVQQAWSSTRIVGYNKDCNRLSFHIRSYRKTLIALLVSTESDGYNPLTLEYIILNKLWVPELNT